MKIDPKFRGFLCLTAHPAGCEKNVRNQIEYVKSKGYVDGPRKVLVIGASTGYGLASRIMATFGSGAATIGVFFEKPASGKRTATPGWYNTAAFEKMAGEMGYYAKSINGDAYSKEIKDKTIELIKKDLGKVDLVVYSLAAPKRVHPVTGETFSSVLKPIGSSYSNKNVDFHTGEISNVTIEPATEEEVKDTIAVMGGEDWQMWIDALQAADALTHGATTVTYSYIGPELTRPIYRDGTIGKAKDDLEASAAKIDKQLQSIGGRAYTSVNKALVTQASAALPVVPLYMAALLDIMRQKGIHEGCIEQMYRLFKERLYSGNLKLDEKGRIRLDDLEMRQDVQEEVMDFWNDLQAKDLKNVTVTEGYRKDFFNLFGFELEGVDYDLDVEPNVRIPSIE